MNRVDKQISGPQQDMSGSHLDSNGFSIVELLITLGVMGVVFGAFITTFTSIQSINKKSLDISSANTAALSKTQDYENKSFTSLPDTAPAGTLVEVEDFSSSLPDTLESPRIGKVYVNTISPTLKQVVVSVKFGAAETQRQVEYGNLIQKYGLGR